MAVTKLDKLIDKAYMTMIEVMGQLDDCKDEYDDEIFNDAFHLVAEAHDLLGDYKVNPNYNKEVK